MSLRYPPLSRRVRGSHRPVERWQSMFRKVADHDAFEPVADQGTFMAFQDHRRKCGQIRNH